MDQQLLVAIIDNDLKKIKELQPLWNELAFKLAHKLNMHLIFLFNNCPIPESHRNQKNVKQFIDFIDQYSFEDLRKALQNCEKENNLNKFSYFMILARKYNQFSFKKVSPYLIRKGENHLKYLYGVRRIKNIMKEIETYKQPLLLYKGFSRLKALVHSLDDLCIKFNYTISKQKLHQYKMLLCCNIPFTEEQIKKYNETIFTTSHNSVVNGFNLQNNDENIMDIDVFYFILRNLESPFSNQFDYEFEGEMTDMIYPKNLLNLVYLNTYAFDTQSVNYCCYWFLKKRELLFFDPVLNHDV